MLRIKSRSVSTQQGNVPLKQVVVDARIRSFAADVTIQQVFRNDEATPIEAVYCFPIEEQAAIYAFVARIDDREIVAELKEKNEAQKQYTDALRDGHGAYLLEQDEKSQDSFIINVGALPADQECRISISYITELDLVNDGQKIRFVVPTTIAPRYNPEKGGITAPGNTNSEYVQSSPYTIEFRCQVEKTDVKGVSSTSHPIQVDLSQDDVYCVTFAQEKSHLDRDILLDIDLSETRSNTIIAVESGAVMASFTPTEEECRRATSNVETANEFIFVIDCSGSMEDEGKIGLARQAMLLFLKSLPVNCHFNILRFGSTHKALFSEITAIYNEENVKNAEQLTNQMRADLGGTELLSPLQWLEEHPPAQGRARQIFLLTDGEISNVDQVLDLCRSMATSSRIFSFGLGQSPSRSLVKGLARASNGRFVFVPPGSNVDLYVGEQLQKALQVSLTNVQIQWNVGTTVTSVPEKIPPIYANDRRILYALADDPTSTFKPDAHVELFTDKYRFGPVKITRVPQVTDNGTIARLAAKALILQLQHSKLPPKSTLGSLQTRFQTPTQPPTTIIEEKQKTKEQIVQLSLKHHILSPHTAFIGVERRDNGNNTGMVLREVPIQISADDQHLQSSSFMNLCAAPQSMMSSLAYTSRRFSPRAFRQMSTAYCCDTSSMDDEDDEDGEAVEVCLRSAGSPMVSSNSSTSWKRSFDGYEEGQSVAQDNEDVWPKGDEDIVRYLIRKQKFDGGWDLDASHIQQLTGKSLTSFSSSTNAHLLHSAIIIVTLETRFASLSTLWFGVVQKARKRLLDLLGNDQKQLDSFLHSIRQQL